MASRWWAECKRIQHQDGKRTSGQTGFGEGGKAELIQVVQGVRASIPDIKPTLYETLAEDDLVSVRVIARGTHTGVPFPPGIPAAGTAMEWKEIHIFRCRNGQIAEHWGVSTCLGSCGSSVPSRPDAARMAALAGASAS